MKKKRLSMFSLLIALTLTLGACDDLEDRYPTGSDSDESSEVAGDEDPGADEDPSSSVNPNEDENPNENENEGNKPSSNKDVTITLSTTSITVKENETDYFSVSLSDSEASILTVSPENATYIEVGFTETASEYYVKGLAAGSTSITITAGGEGFNTATATLPVTITPADVYTYKMIISNASEVPTTGWVHNSTDVSFTFAPKLETYKNETLESTTDLSASDVTISVSNDEETASQIIAVTGLTISPAGKAGTVTVTASYTGELTVSDSYTYTVTVDETYSSVHTLKIDTTDVPESETVGEGGFDISAYLITATTAESWDKTETSSVPATESDVTISVCPEGAMNVAGLHVVPTANVTEETNVTITVVWTAYSEEETASDSISLTIYPKDSATYSMSITNESDFTGSWYTEDDAKTISLSITSSDVEENPIDVDQLISDGKITARAITENVVSIDGLTVTPVAKGTTTIYVVWTEHTEANASISVTVLEHSYKLTITNKDELAQDWSIEDGSRSLQIELSSDREDITKEASTSNVTITYDTSAFTTSDGGFTLTPVQTGTYTITATWVDDNLAIGAEGVDSFSVTINDNVKVTNLSLDYTELSLEYGETGTLTASLTGLEGKTATSTDITWTSDSDDVIVSGNGLTATVISYVYGATATITATSVENSEATATCSVNIAEQNVTMATYVNEYFVDEVMTSPDNEGVYVFGDGNGTYASSLTSTTAIYNSATPIRVKQAEDGYYLLLNEAYLTSSLATSTSADDAAIFTISGEGVITTGSSTLGFNGASLALESVDTSAYLIDYVTKEATENTSGGTYYLGAFNGVRYKYASAFNSNNLSVTEDANSALEFTLESAGGDLYYLSYMNGDTKTYVYISSTDTNGNASNKLGTSTTASGCELTFDTSTNAWTYIYDEGGSNETAHALIYSSQNDVINGYKASNIGATNYYVATLIHVPDAPDAKGIGLYASELTVNANETLQINSKVYPSCVSDNAVSWSSGNESSATVDESGLVSGISAADEVVITATSGSVSSSITIKVEAADETLIGIYDFALSGNTYSDSNAASDDNLKAMIQASWSGLGSDPLSSVSASNCFRGAGGTSDSYPVQETKAAIKMCSSKNQGTMSLTFGSGTGIKKVVITACGYDGSGTNYILSVGTSSSDVTSQQMKESAKDSSLLSVSEVSSYEWDFTSGSDSIYLEGKGNGSTAYRIILFSIAIYNA